MNEVSLLALSVLVGLAVGCGGGGDASQPSVAGLDLPEAVAGWQAGEDAIYDAESIFDYIDGHAEVYLAYGMERCLARRYRGPEGEPDIVLDVFELPSSEAAFGVFTHEPDGEPVELGQGGLEQAGWLRFWKGRFFVSLYPEGESRRAVEVAREVASAVADSITRRGSRPPLVEALPAEGLDRRSIRWVMSPEVLGTALELAERDPYQVGPESPAVLAHYRRDGASAVLVVVEHPDAAEAERSGARLASLRGTDSADGTPRAAADGSWWAATVHGRYVVAVTAADAPSLAGELLREMESAVAQMGGER